MTLYNTLNVHKYINNHSDAGMHNGENEKSGARMPMHMIVQYIIIPRQSYT